MRKKKKNIASRPKANRHDVVLKIVASDSTFKSIDNGYVGKCIFCRGKIFVSKSGKTNATIEHIVPINAGGSNELKNIALAHKECNNEKGIRHDPNYPNDLRAKEVIDKLLSYRLERWVDHT